MSDEVWEGELDAGPPPPLLLAGARARLTRAAQQKAHAHMSQQARAAQRAANGGDATLGRARDRAAAAKREAKAAAKRLADAQPVAADLVVGLAAAGVSKKKIARVLHVEQETVSRVLTKSPGSRERILQLREELKDLKLTRAHAVEARLWDRLEKEVDTGEAKSVDAMTRALLASEKIQAAASGEAAASGAALLTPSSTDLAGLVQILIASS